MYYTEAGTNEVDWLFYRRLFLETIRPGYSPAHKPQETQKGKLSFRDANRLANHIKQIDRLEETLEDLILLR